MEIEGKGDGPVIGLRADFDALLNGLFGIEWAASGAFIVNIVIIIAAFIFIKVFLLEKVEEILE